jgi:hypothetical protein
MVKTALGAATVRRSAAGLGPLQLVQARGWLAGDTGQHVGELGAGIDAVQLGGGDELIHRRERDATARSTTHPQRAEARDWSPRRTPFGQHVS